MSKFTAFPQKIHLPPGTIKDFMGNLSNLQTIMPEQVEQWQSNELSCSFFIRNIGALSMQKGEFYFPNQYNFNSTENSKVKFTLTFHFQLADDKDSTGFFELDADMNPMVEMLAKRPLTNFVNILTENLRKIAP